MNWRSELKPLLYIIGGFSIAYFLPIERTRFSNAILEAFTLLKWYAQEHVILCLVPAFFIAGVIAVFISQSAVIKYFGARAKKWLAYMVASVSGTVLAVCSCTILPLFSSIYKRGAGLGPAITFLYSGPAINILAIILTARILGFKLGIARIIGAVIFAVVIGLIMHLIYRKEEQTKADEQLAMPTPEETRPLWQTASHFFILVLILIFANWGKTDTITGFWYVLYSSKWIITALFGVLFMVSLIMIMRVNIRPVLMGAAAVVTSYLIWPGQPMIPFIVAILGLTIILSTSTDESQEWMKESWGFARQILPLLALGVLAAGFLLGSQEGRPGLIPNEWITNLVGGNTIRANFFASVVGAFMYFATLTEVPILQGLINSGMGQGPALALLLAGPALSLPNMLVIRQVIGTQKTIVYILLVVVMSTIAGIGFGIIQS